MVPDEYPYINPQERPAGTRGKPPTEPVATPAQVPEPEPETPAPEAAKDGE